MKKVFSGLFSLLLLLSVFIFMTSCAGQNGGVKDNNAAIGSEADSSGGYIEEEPVYQPDDETVGGLREDSEYESLTAYERNIVSMSMEEILGGKVYFDFDSSILKSDARDVLLQLAVWLKHHKDINISIEGHCDERGTAEYNIALSEKRADSVKTFLIDEGVESLRLNVVGYGEEKPADPGHNEAAWAKNRRAEFILNK